MNKSKPAIIFASAVCPSQYSLLCQYLNENRIAETFYMTTPGNTTKFSSIYSNLESFRPDGNIMKSGYYYSAKAERSARLARGLLQGVNNFIQKYQKPDLIVCHSAWAPPQFVIRELDIPVVTYLEFPCYIKHGWNPEYPPDLSQRLTDCNMEMISYYHILQSALTIVPSAYSQSLLPSSLKSMVRVQFEGFEIDKIQLQNDASTKSKDTFTLGFTARDLSEAKGLEIFIRIVNQLIEQGDTENMEFVAIGDPAASSYGYDRQYAQRYFSDESKTFLDYLLSQYPKAKIIDFKGKLAYSAYSELINKIDLFVYPLRHGVANWGLIELMARNKPVIASNRTFIPEFIINGENGILVDGGIDDWTDAIKQLRTNSELRMRIGNAAGTTSRSLDISNVAKNYMALFEDAIRIGNNGIPSEITKMQHRD